MKCAYLDNVRIPDRFKHVDVLEVLNDIKSEKYHSLINALPDPETNKEAYKAAKNNLPAWAFNGTFGKKVVNDDFSESNGLFHIDIDGIEDPQKLKYEMARDIPEIIALWLSPSRKGLKGLLRIPDDFIHNDGDFKKAFKQISAYLASYGVTIDRACKDVRRVCYVSIDKDIFINDDAPAFMFDVAQWNESEPDNTIAFPTLPTLQNNQKVRSNNGGSFKSYEDRIRDTILNAGSGNYHDARLRAGKLAGGLVAGKLMTEGDAKRALKDASDQIHAAHRDSSAVRATETEALRSGYNMGLSQPISDETAFYRSAKHYSDPHAKQYHAPAYPENHYHQEPQYPQIDDHQETQPQRAFTPIHQLIKNRKVLSWVIRDYFPLESACCLYGESGAGKSFLALDMALHVATGMDWQNHRTKQGAVFYVAGEGNIGITARCHAWSLKNEIPIDESTLFYCTDGAIMPQDEMQAVMLVNEITHWINSTGAKPMMIFFDTLARCFLGEENSSTDAGAYISAIDALKQRFKCCVVSVHHTGKDTTKGGRGSSAFKGAWDMEHALSADKDSGIKKLETTKAKDIQTPFDKAFTLEQVDTGWLDDDGEPVTSAVVVFAGYDAATVKSKPLSSRNRAVLGELRKAIERDGIPPMPAIRAIFRDSPHNTPKLVVHGDKWREMAFTVIDATQKSKAFSDCKNQLRDYGKVGFYDGYFWLAND